MNNEAKHEIDAIVNMYGYELIRRGFIEDDETICRALRHIGELVNRARPTSHKKPSWFVWEGWEAIRGVTTE